MPDVSAGSTLSRFSPSPSMSGKKNLLEAFQRRETATPGSPPAPAAPTLPFEGRAVGSAGARRGLFLLVLLALTFAFGYALGRRSAPEARAAGDEQEAPVKPTPRPSAQPRSFDARQGGPAPAAAGTSTRIEDSALFAPANQYTIVAGAYSKAKTDYAWATHDHLLEEGLAVFPPVASGNLLIVLVGAAPRGADLEEMLARVKRLERDGKKVYDDAYVHPIDKLISRNLTKD